MIMKLSKAEEAAFLAAGEPRSEPDYSEELSALMDSLTPEQERLLLSLTDAFSNTVRYERRWYFHRGWLAAKRAERK